MNTGKSAAVAIPTGPIITLAYRVLPERRTELLEFLERAVPFYEEPGGIRIALYESLDDPALLLELVAYESIAAYEADQARVESNPKMQALLAEWRTFFDGSLEVQRMKPIQFSYV
jgi:quinol monooxygenase YgiN